jgi:hypothetical protein
MKETDVASSGLGQQGRQGRDRLEIDMAVIPERREMGLHLSRHGEREVLVRRRNDRPPRLDEVEERVRA